MLPKSRRDRGELRGGIGMFIKFYNYKRPHQNLDKLLLTIKYGVPHKSELKIWQCQQIIVSLQRTKRVPCSPNPKQARVAPPDTPPCSEIYCLTLSKNGE